MKRSVIVRLVTSKLWFPVIAGGIAFQTGGCDPTVRDTLLTGIQTSLVGFMTALLDAVFQTLANVGTSATSGSSTSQPVVQAAFDTFKNWLA